MLSYFHKKNKVGVAEMEVRSLPSDHKIPGATLAMHRIENWFEQFFFKANSAFHPFKVLKIPPASTRS